MVAEGKEGRTGRAVMQQSPTGLICTSAKAVVFPYFNIPFTGRRQHKLCCQSNRANVAINPGMRQQVPGQPVMLLKHRCCSNADLCKAFAAVQKGWLVTWRTYFFLLWLVTYFLGEISLLSRVTPQCNTCGYVSTAHACMAQAAADPRKAS